VSAAALAPPVRLSIHPAAWAGALIFHLALAMALLPREAPLPQPGAPFAVGLMGLEPAGPLGGEMAPAEALAGPQPEALAEAAAAAEDLLPVEMPMAQAPAPAPASLPSVPPELIRPETEAPAELAPATAADVLAPSPPESVSPTEEPLLAPPAPPPPPAPARAAPRTSVAAASAAPRRPTQSAPARAAAGGAALSAAAPAGTGQGEAPALSAAPSPGAEAARLPPGYAATISRLLQGALRYPPGARDAGVEGSALVMFTIARDGTIFASRLQRSSGDQALDSEALALLRRVSPLPPLPEEVPGQAAAVVVPIAFRLR
jgi:TonB family protein